MHRAVPCMAVILSQEPATRFSIFGRPLLLGSNKIHLSSDRYFQPQPGQPKGRPSRLFGMAPTGWWVTLGIAISNGYSKLSVVSKPALLRGVQTCRESFRRRTLQAWAGSRY